MVPMAFLFETLLNQTQWLSERRVKFQSCFQQMQWLNALSVDQK